MGRPSKRATTLPKRPESAFFLFCKTQQTKVQREFLNKYKEKLSKKELMKVLAERWNDLPREQKRVS